MPKRKTSPKKSPPPNIHGYDVKRSQHEIDEQLNRAAAWEDNGGTAVPGMTYEQGVRAGIDWLLGDIDDVPIEEEPDE